MSFRIRVFTPTQKTLTLTLSRSTGRGNKGLAIVSDEPLTRPATNGPRGGPAKQGSVGQCPTARGAGPLNGTSSILTLNSSLFAFNSGAYIALALVGSALNAPGISARSL
jgi:hypothetical protein